MVSWSNETSEDSVLNISSSCDGIIKLPAMMHDPNFNGTDTNVNVLCEHGEPAERFVAFEWMHTGRRFIGCAKKEGINCGVVQWIDFEWPDSMEEALAKLWDMYEETKSARTNDNLESSKMLLNYETLKNLTCAQANVIRNLKFNHLKEERLTKEKLKLQYHISELQKSEEKIKLKLQGVKAILDE
ncbi:hypothetical protein VPH35_106225 [Triticum aestivum]